MIDIVMLSNIDWNIADRTRESLLQYAKNDRVILQVEPDYIHLDDCKVPILDKRKMEIVKTKALSDSIYFLDDDDWLLQELQPVRVGFDGAIYNVQYGNEVLSGVDCKRVGVALGYARCIFSREWLLKVIRIAEENDIQALFDVFLLYELALRGKAEIRDTIITGIDRTPRTMYCNKFRKHYHMELHKIKGMYKELS